MLYGQKAVFRLRKDHLLTALSMVTCRMAFMEEMIMYFTERHTDSDLACHAHERHKRACQSFSISVQISGNVCVF